MPLFLLLIINSLSAADWPRLSAPAAPVAQSAQDAAVIVGIERYAFVSPVAGAAENADAWHDYLTKTLAVPFERVTLLKNEDATREELTQALERAAGQAGEGGTLWFVFIGHGAPSPDGKGGVLVGADAQQKAASLLARGLRESETRTILAKSKAGRIRVILDACFSGRDSAGGSLAPGLQPLIAVKPAGAADPRMAVLTAARADQFAGPLPGEARPAFSYLILGALRGWAGEKAVTAGAAVDYANKVLASMVRGRQQTATLLGKHDSPMAPSPGEAGPDLARLQKASTGRAVMFKAADLPEVAAPKAPEALALAVGMDWKSVDVDALEAYHQIVALDKSDAAPAEKARRWREFGAKDPKRRAEAEKRAGSWEAYAASAKRAADSAIARASAFRKDWEKLMRLVRMEVVSAEDKSAWALQFLEAYKWGIGRRAEALEPFIGDMGPLRKERELSCENGRVEDCYTAALLSYYGLGVAKDLFRAARLWEKSCALGSARGCVSAARAAAKGEGVAQDFAKAFEGYQKACEKGNRNGCRGVGIMYFLAESVAKDEVKAVEYFRKACDLGDPEGCTDMGVAYRNGEGGLPKDSVRAARFYEQSCEMGDENGCFRLGDFWESGPPVAPFPSDKAKAKEFYRRACEGRLQEACQALTRLSAN